MAGGIVRKLYRHHFKETPRERLFLSSISFFLTFALTRAIVHLIRAGYGPIHNLAVGATHVHHLVWGILLLLLVGYCWLIHLDADGRRSSDFMSRLLAIVYGAWACPAFVDTSRDAGTMGGMDKISGAGTQR